MAERFRALDLKTGHTDCSRTILDWSCSIFTLQIIITCYHILMFTKGCIWYVRSSDVPNMNIKIHEKRTAVKNKK